MLSLVATVNAWVDPAGILARSDRATHMAEKLLAGQPIALGEIDDRRIHAAYAKHTSRAPDVVIFGSSRVMELGEGVAPGRMVYNAATGSNTMNDLIALAGLFVRDDRKPRYAVIGVDSWLFDARPRNARWRALNEDYLAMSARIGLPADADAAEEAVWRSLISLDYTRASLAEISADWRAAFTSSPPKQKVDDADGFKRADGSLVYPAAFRARDAGQIRADALAHGHKHVTELLKGGLLDPKSTTRFTRLLAYLSGAGVRVVLLLPPYHPAHYDYVRSQQETKALDRIEAFVHGLARAGQVQVAGSYDPVRAGCAESEFWDGLHARRSCLGRLLTPAMQGADS